MDSPIVKKINKQTIKVLNQKTAIQGAKSVTRKNMKVELNRTVSNIDEKVLDFTKLPRLPTSPNKALSPLSK